jgi:hypothetical protein
VTASTRLFEDLDESVRGIKVIDAGTRLTEPADLWTSRAPKKRAGRVLRVIRPGEIAMQHPAALRGTKYEVTEPS